MEKVVSRPNLLSTHSYGFRPGRSAHAAVKAARAYVQSGRCYVVDMDLEKFFDRVNHDVLMSRLARRIGDRRVLRLIRRYLGAGVMAQGVLMERYEGTPQGGPLSPLLANVLLDEMVKLKVAGKALETMKEHVRQITRRTCGRSVEQVVKDLREYLPGWKAYFSLSEAQGTLRDLDIWIRHRLRAIHLKHWKRGKTTFREMRRRGASVELAAAVAVNTRRWWNNSAMGLHVVLPTRYFDQLGVPRLQSTTSTP